MYSHRAQNLHPLSRASALDSSLRHCLQKPERILKPYVQKGMRVLDLGCGTGYFTLALAKMVGCEGLVNAVDVQAGMLTLLQKKLEHQPERSWIHLQQNTEHSLTLSHTYDFVLAFYTFHEVKYLAALLETLKKHLNPRARILVVEQYFHVSQRQFKAILELMKTKGYKRKHTPHIFFSRAAVLEIQRT